MTPAAALRRPMPLPIAALLLLLLVATPARAARSLLGDSAASGTRAAESDRADDGVPDHTPGIELGHARPLLLAAALGPDAIQELVAEVCSNGGAAVPKAVVRHVNNLVAGAKLTDRHMAAVAAKVREALRLPELSLGDGGLVAATMRTFQAMRRSGGLDRRDVGRLCSLAPDPSGSFVHRLAARNPGGLAAAR